MDDGTLGCLVIFLISIPFVILHEVTGHDIFLYLFMAAIFALVVYGFLNKKPEQKEPYPFPTPEPKPKPTDVDSSRTGLSETQFQSSVQKQLNEYERGKTSIFWVGDKHRTHPWSVMPGGCTVVVIYEDGECRGYDKVKRPHKYLQKVSNDYISNFTSNRRTKTLEEYIECLYAIREGKVKLNLVWRKGTKGSPWSLLEAYATK